MQLSTVSLYAEEMMRLSDSNTLAEALSECLDDTREEPLRPPC